MQTYWTFACTHITQHTLQKQTEVTWRLCTIHVADCRSQMPIILVCIAAQHNSTAVTDAVVDTNRIKFNS